MNLEHLPDNARVWVYQADRPFTTEEEAYLNNRMTDFVSQWKAHGSELMAGFELRDQRWLILAVDESRQSATGCSIDGSVHLIKTMGEELGIDFFNRTKIVWEADGERHEDPMHDFWAKRKAGIVSDEVSVFNTLANNLGELRKSWKQPFNESWHAEMWK